MHFAPPTYLARAFEPTLRAFAGLMRYFLKQNKIIDGNKDVIIALTPWFSKKRLGHETRIVFF
jgi:hypothetical protein